MGRRRNAGYAGFARTRPGQPTYHYLPATADIVHWGYFRKLLKPQLEVDSGDYVTIEALTHHANDDAERMVKGDPGAESVFLWTKDKKGVNRRGAGPIDGKLLGRGAGEGFRLGILHRSGLCPRRRAWRHPRSHGREATALRQSGGFLTRLSTLAVSLPVKVLAFIDDWLAQFGIKPHHTNTAIGQFTVKGEDQRTGKPVNRRVAVIAISVGMRSRRNKGNSHVVRNRIWSASKVP